MTILVVDDHAETRQVLHVLLETAGYAVVEAEDGEEALRAFASVTVDAVITDILMPRMDGYRLCHALRSDPKTRQVPIIFYTATYTSDEDERMSLELGADCFVRKPAPASKILNTVAGVLARKGDSPKATAIPPGLESMQRYSQQLVGALEAKNLELERQKAALQESEQRFRQLFEMANAALFLVRVSPDARAGRFIDVNDVACQMLGYSRAELLARTPRDLDPPDEREGFADIATRLQREKRIVFERLVVAKDGRRVPVEVSARLLDAGGETRCIAALRDITERKQAERWRSAVSVTLSHELNTPLNGILGMLQLVEGGAKAPEPGDVQEAIAGIGESARRLHALVQRNLDYARLELLGASGGKPVPAPPDELRNLAGVAQKQARETAASVGRAADLQLEVGAFAGAMAERWLKRLVVELLDNAFKFSVAGQPVRLRAAMEDGKLHLAVQDGGRGMQAEQVAALGAFIQFERAYYEQQGMGLGLYLARQIARLHGGALTIDTAPGDGTIVAIAVPANLRPDEPHEDPHRR